MKDTLNVRLAVNFSYVPFIMLRNSPSIPSFLSGYSFSFMKLYQLLSKSFSASVEIMCVFLFHSVNVEYYIG